MPEADNSITVTLRIPGQWSHPRELIERLPSDVRLTPEALIMPDGTEIEFSALEADDQFAGIFRSSCRQPPTDAERSSVENYKVNVCLSGPGGSLDAARTMMKAGAAIVQAGGAGVFIDNSTVAHGGQNWSAMAEDGGTDALSFAYVALVADNVEVWTMGMQVLGLPEVLMKRVDADKFDIIDVIRYLCQSDAKIGDRHLIGDLDGPQFQAFRQESEAKYKDSPMYNPFGRLKLVNMKEIAEAN